MYTNVINIFEYLFKESTKGYMQKNRVPKDLQRRVLLWYDYTWNR